MSPRPCVSCLLGHYLETLERVEPVDDKLFMRYFYSFVMMRVMQALGAYGYLAAVKGKKNFLKSVPFALTNLQILLEKAPVLEQLPALRQIYINLIKDPDLRAL